jgi:AcrR family transcriptional regulator
MPSGQDAGLGRTAVYASRLMQDRRRRILDTARQMIAEGGLDQFSMRELGQRADVAQRTLYNAFQSKDHLLAEAVREYYEDFVGRTKYRFEAGTLDGTMERLLLVHRRNIQIKNYTRTIMSVYFSTTIDHELWMTIHRISADNHRLWIGRMAAKRQLHAWVETENVADRLANLEYATINEWCQDRIPDEAFVTTLAVTVLTFVAGLTRGAAHKEIVAALAQLVADEPPR